MTQALELHVPFLERPFPDDLAISKWVCKQAPLAAVRAVEAENTATAARLATTRPRLMLRCVQCCAVCNDSTTIFPMGAVGKSVVEYEDASTTP